MTRHDFMVQDILSVQTIWSSEDPEFIGALLGVAFQKMQTAGMTKGQAITITSKGWEKA